MLGSAHSGKSVDPPVRAEPASRFGHDFSRVPVHPPTGKATLTSGKSGTEAAEDEESWFPIAGNGGAPAPAAPAAPPAPAPAPAPAAPAPAAAAPKLTKKTVRGPTAADCGGFQWVVQWQLDRATTLGGWVVQKVELPHDVKDCAGKAVDPGTAGGLDPSWYPVWEAWPINKGQKVTTYAEGGDKDDDTYGSRGPGSATKGTLEVKGTAEFYDGLTLPPDFKVANAAPTWILPATKTAPSLAGGTGAISHNLKATWDCCGADKTTKITPV